MDASGEMQFYLLWPQVNVLLVCLSKRSVLVVLLVLFLWATTNRWLQATPNNPLGFYVRTDARMSGFILGSLLAFSELRSKQGWASLGLLLFAFVRTFCNTQRVPSARYGLTRIGFGHIDHVSTGLAGSAFWHWLATLSYGWYLWDYYFMQILQYYGVSWEYTLLAGEGWVVC